MRETVRTLLEEIAFGGDPAVRPDHRLRAVELLAEMGAPDDDRFRDFHAELGKLDDRELDLHFDTLLGRKIVDSALADKGDFPEMESAIRRAVEERAQKIVAAFHRKMER